MLKLGNPGFSTHTVSGVDPGVCSLLHRFQHLGVVGKSRPNAARRWAGATISSTTADEVGRSNAIVGWSAGRSSRSRHLK
jgi:hypothetical protein